MNQIMRNVYLIRCLTGDSGTFGKMIIPDQKVSYHSLELPWRDNQQGISCIPEGSYLCTRRKSPKFGWTYILNGVPGRSYILIHSANFGGDVSKGYKSHLRGCITLGLKKMYMKLGEGSKIGRQRAVGLSKTAIKDFEKTLDCKPFRLHVLSLGKVDRNNFDIYKHELNIR